MKTILLLLVALLMPCCRDRSAPPTVLSARDDSRDSRNASGEALARQSDSATSEAATQIQKVELWDPNNDLNVADRMLERVKQDGVVRIASFRASADRYVFVGEFEETWKFVPTLPPRPKTDLWLVNKNGTGLRRLTSDGESYDPQWAPSGEEIAFINFGSVCVIGVESSEVKPALFGSSPAQNGGYYFQYSQPRFSPNGKAVAALAKDRSTCWVKVAARLSDGWAAICTFAKGFERYDWKSERELIVDYGRLVFDWEHFNSDDDASLTNSDNAGFARTPRTLRGKHREPQVSAQLLKRLLRKLRRYGVKNIDSDSVVHSGRWIVFAGEFEGYLDLEDRHESDLWVVNRDGSGLRRLTENHRSYQPALSPLGRGVAFVDGDSISVIDVKTRSVRRLPGLQGYKAEDIMASWGYLLPRWSPNGKVIAAIGVDEGPGWTQVVEARFGHAVLDARFGTDRFAWNHEGELIIGNDAKFVFDWSSAIFNRPLISRRISRD